MRLYELFTEEEAKKKGIGADAEIEGLCFDSRKVKKNDLFFALNGSSENGTGYAGEALLGGAVAVVTEDCAYFEGTPHAALMVQNVREALSVAAARFFGEAHKKVNLIGVVGTNGKTSVTYILEAILKAAGKKVLVIGTLGMQMNGVSVVTDMTTPDPIVLHKGISDAWKDDAEYVVMEVSAHAIYWKKTYGIYFDALIFTNFSEDHLDFFKTMDAYKSVKKSIFTIENARFAVINADDTVGRELFSDNRIPCITYGIENPSDVFPINVKIGGGVTFIANLFDEIIEIDSNLNGYFNVYNLLAALTAAKVLKISVETAAEAIKKLPPIAGRFNVYRRKKTVVVDYAHTPDGLENILKSAREMTSGHVICVFGCGGNRDRLKRPLMGGISGRLADFTVITTDNSRYENSEAIMDGIEDGISPVTDNYVRILERRKAILYAVGLATEKDIVVVAGKGEENYIEEDGKKTFYMDKLVVEEALRRY